MKGNFMKGTLVLWLAVSTFVSCIRDKVENCPPLKVTIAVKDKNYFNIDQVDFEEERKASDLAFREYIPTLTCILRDAHTGEIKEERGLFNVTGDEETVQVQFCPCLPHGKYILTVWGGLSDLSPLDNDYDTMDLHPGHMEGEDIYMVNDTLVYDAYNYDYIVEMERTKGKLIVLAENLPQNVEYSSESVDNLFAGVNCNFHYSGNTHVDAKSAWIGNQAVMKTVLAPSVKERSSLLGLQFYDSEQRDGVNWSPEDVRITMRRNELTMLRYVWDDVKRDFMVYMRVNDNWDLIHGMEID